MRLHRLVQGKVAAIALSSLVALAALPGAALAGTWDRIAGSDAYGTMAAISEKGFDSADTVILASGDGYWDALAASGLAGRLKSPVLLTPGDYLCNEAKSEILRLAPSRVIVVGGPMAVSEDVLNSLTWIVDKVDRVNGEDAPETSIRAMKEVGGWSKTVVIASSDGYWDALSIAPYAYASAAPVLLTDADGTLSSSALDAIELGGFDHAIIAGGKLSVSEWAETQLANIGVDVDRYDGEDAIGTSAAIARFELRQGFSADPLFVASSDGYWDALSGAALAGSLSSILVLDTPSNHSAIEAVYDPTEDDNSGYVLGGSFSVPDTTLQWLRNERPDYYSLYVPVLRAAAEEDRYSVFDLGADGVPELIVTRRLEQTVQDDLNGPIVAQNDVYTIKDGSAVLQGSYVGHLHSQDVGNTSGRLYEFLSDSGNLCEISLSDGELHFELVETGLTTADNPYGDPGTWTTYTEDHDLHNLVRSAAGNYDLLKIASDNGQYFMFYD